MPVETVLLPVSDSDEDRIHHLVDAVLETAAPVDATVVVGHAIPKNTDDITPAVTPITGSGYPQLLSKSEYDDLLEEYSPDEIAAEHDTIQSVIDRLEAANVDYDVRGAVGDPGEAFLDLADAVDADRIVVGGRHRSPADKAIFGSVAQTLILDASCPVTFVQNDD